MESILKNYFHCPLPFDVDGHLTEHGAKKVEELIQLLHDLENIGVIHDAHAAEIEIDEIVHSDDRSSEKQVYIRELRRMLVPHEEYKLKKMIKATKIDGSKFSFNTILIDIDTADVFCYKFSKKDEYSDTVMLSDLSLQSVTELFERFMQEKIDDGYDWKQHAYDVIKKTFPNEPEDLIHDFIYYFWENLATDASNIEAYKAQE